MYEIFDRFLDVDTWHTMHTADETRFFAALNNVVRLEAFNPDTMAAYMRERFHVPAGEVQGLGHTIRRYQDMAWAIKDFLQATEPR